VKIPKAVGSGDENPAPHHRPGTLEIHAELVYEILGVHVWTLPLGLRTYEALLFDAYTTWREQP